MAGAAALASVPHMLSSARRLPLLIAMLGAMVLVVPAGASAAVTRGALSQLTGATGCLAFDGLSEDGAGTCTDVRNMKGASDLLVSPDGANVYVSQYYSPYGITSYRRDATTGALTQLPGTDGCISQNGASIDDGPDTCANGRDMYAGEGHALAISPDGAYVYGSSSKGGITVFHRDAATGALTQLPGVTGCYTADGSSDDDGAGTCTTTPALQDGYVYALTMSADGRFLYSPYAYASGAEKILTFARDAATGAISPVAGGCLSRVAAPGCTVARQVGYGQHLSITPDGRHAYAAQYSADGVAVLDRDPATGLLSQPAGLDGCISNDGGSQAGAGTCRNVRAIEGAFDTMVSKDGTTLWVMGYSSYSIAAFRIDPATGALTQLPGLQGCISYDGSSDDGPGTCTDGHGQYYPYGLALSPDGRTLYQAEYDRTLTVYDVDQSTGALTQLPGTEGCFSVDSKGSTSVPAENVAGVCTDTRGLINTYSVAVSPDGNSVYTTGYTDHGTIGVFSRQAAASCSAATATVQSKKTVSVTLPCADPNGDAVTRAITSPPAHGTLSAVAGDAVTYTPAAGFTGTDTFSYNADDGGGAGTAGTATVTVTPAPDTTKPKLTLLSGKKDGPRLVKTGIRLRVKVSEAAAIKAAVTLSSSSAKKAKLAKTKTVTIASASAKATKATTLTLILKPTRKAKRTLLKLKGRALKKFTPKLTITAKDPAGNTGTLGKAKLKIVR